jgi:hypothetical protein
VQAAGSKGQAADAKHVHPYQPWQFYVASYGAKGDGKVIADAVMASTGSGVLTSATAGFTAGDVGKFIIVNVGTAGQNQAPLCTTIASFQSATQVTLTANPPATAAGNPAIYGTDDVTAINAAITAANSYAVAGKRRGQVIFDALIYCLGSATTKGSSGGPYYGNSILPIPVSDTTGASGKVNLDFTGAGPADETIYWEQKVPLVTGTALVPMYAAPAPDGTWGIPSVIGGPTVASGSGFSLTGGFANLRVHLDGIKIVVPYNPGWIGMDARYLACSTGGRYGYQAFSVGVLGGGLGPNTGSVPGGSWNFNGSAWRFPVINNNDLCDVDSLTAEGVADAIWIADHVTIRSLKCINNANGIVVDATSGSASGHVHGSWIGYASLEAQSGNGIIVSGSGYSQFPLVIGLLDSENSGSLTDVNDSGILTGTVGWYNINGSVPKVTGTTGIKLVNHRLTPGPWGSPPAVPASGVAVAASAMPWRDAAVTVTGGTNVTAITVGGTATGVTFGTVIVPSGQSVAVTYSSAPSWTWVLL